MKVDVYVNLGAKVLLFFDICKLFTRKSTLADAFSLGIRGIG